MEISYNWLRDLVDTKLSHQELKDKLTSVGLAVEGVHANGDDFVFDIDLTSNRGDCLSHIGVAREIAAIEKTQVSSPKSQVINTEGKASDFTGVKIEDPDLCWRYAGRVVRGVKVGPSPEWLVKRLEAVGERSINNIADITNYVMHETGQPLHAFDLAKLKENRIVVRRARAGETLTTLDGVERKFDEEMLLICDADKPVAIGGVMGGEESGISDETQDVFIESAFFSRSSVRRTSKLLGLATEASYRFERGTDIEGVVHAQSRCIELICELAGGTTTEDTVDVYPTKREPIEIVPRLNRVKSLTGLNVEFSEAVSILHSLGFKEKDSTVYTFIVPSWRHDIEREEDLIEEIARHYGYDKIPYELPPSVSAGEYQPTENKRKALRGSLSLSGFDEAISYSFIDTAHDDKFETIPNFVHEQEERFVTLQDSIIEGATRMRPTLLAGLLSAVRHNINHGIRDVRLFELGKLFAAPVDVNDLPDEREAFAIVITGGATEENKSGTVRELDFYDLKGAFETAVSAMHKAPLQYESTSAKHLREGQAAVVKTEDGKPIGKMGRLSDEIAESYKFRQPVYVCEVDLNALFNAKEQPAVYTPLARYPSATRDASLLVSRRVTFAELLETVKEQNVAGCKRTSLVDVYEGKGIADDKRSITLRFEYRSDERTLRDEEVDAMHSQIIGALNQTFGAEQRQ